MTINQFTFRLIIAILLGFIIGLERQFTGHPAGIRTNVLVCFGTCLFLQLPMILDLNSEIARVESYIISGVGFLCSSVIFKDGGNVKGLNTAATLWCSAAVGTFSSTGNVHFAGISAFILIITNILFRPIANHIYPLTNFDDSDKRYAISIICREKDEFYLRSYLIKAVRDKKMYLVSLDSNELSDNKIEVKAEYTCFYKNCIPLLEDIISNCIDNDYKDRISAKWEQI